MPNGQTYRKEKQIDFCLVTILWKLKIYSQFQHTSATCCETDEVGISDVRSDCNEFEVTNFDLKQIQDSDSAK